MADQFMISTYFLGCYLNVRFVSSQLQQFQIWRARKFTFYLDCRGMIFMSRCGLNLEQKFVKCPVSSFVQVHKQVYKCLQLSGCQWVNVV